MYKIIGADGKEYGPITVEQLRQWIAEGRVNDNTLIQPAGASEWRRLNSFSEFAGTTTTAPPPISSGTPLHAQNISRRASNKVAAGVCGILLGGLGIHKFILGFTNAGLIMLAITLVSIPAGFITCGITWLAPSVMHIIGLIEGIIYLTKTDEEFVRIYVEGRKEWF